MEYLGYTYRATKGTITGVNEYLGWGVVVSKSESLSTDERVKAHMNGVRVATKKLKEVLTRKRVNVPERG